MEIHPPQSQRELRQIKLHGDLVIVGGGLAGICCAITAAREGVKVILLQDRPVLGGNSSSEVRLWVLGATAHLFNNNRWAREGGVIDELLVENMWRNPEGNPLIFDTILLEKTISEENITLLLNTAVFEVIKTQPDQIDGVRGFCSQNSTDYAVMAPLFVDASGDGIVGFLSGAAFRIGAEAQEEFQEKLAPDRAYGELLGQSIYFYSKDTGRPVKFVAPAFALSDITQIPRYRAFNTSDFGCRLWWIEYGGRLDPVHDTEEIKWELWKVVYGVWDYIKNSGKFPDADTLTLEWVGQIPGKRESRRFEGDYLLRQQDIVEQRHHDDAVAFGGWSIDLHPADGVFSPQSGCDQYDTRGIYEIPYRCLYSRNIRNLFLAGRLISATHVAFASTRVMATCAHAAQAVGCAAALCRENSLLPADLLAGGRLRELQQRLLLSGQHIPRLQLNDPADLVRSARISASSELSLSELPATGPWRKLGNSFAQLLPVAAGPIPQFHCQVSAASQTTLRVELRRSEKAGNFTPDSTLATLEIKLPQGENQTVELHFPVELNHPGYVFLVWLKNPEVALKTSEQRITGLLSVAPRPWREYQDPIQDLGIDSFELWCPERRPDGQNISLQINPPLAVFAAQNVTNGVQRPTAEGPNAWVAAIEDLLPTLRLDWNSAQSIRRIELFFDTDFDHPMETVLMGHPESAMPFCVREYRILDEQGNILAEKNNNHQTRNQICFEDPVVTRSLRIVCLKNFGSGPISLFGVRAYER